MDGDGNLTDGLTREKIRQQLEVLVNWTLKLKSEPLAADAEASERYP